MKTPPEVPRITDAPAPHGQDVKSRMIKYSVSMGVRLLCLVGAVLLDGWLRWVAIAGAIVLPYFAVVVANAGREPHAPHAESLMEPSAPAPLPAPGRPSPADDAEGSGTGDAESPGDGGKAGDGDFIVGEIVDDERL